MYDIWVEFNDIGVDGQVVTHQRLAREGQIIEVGEELIAGDDEGNQCHARITDVSTDGLVKLALDPDGFVPTSGDTQLEQQPRVAKAS